jgi:hypothetical protein
VAKVVAVLLPRIQIVIRTDLEAVSWVLQPGVQNVIPADLEVLRLAIQIVISFDFETVAGVLVGVRIETFVVFLRLWLWLKLRLPNCRIDRNRDDTNGIPRTNIDFM